MKNKGEEFAGKSKQASAQDLKPEETPRSDTASLSLQAEAAFKRARRLHAFVHKDWISSMKEAQQAKMAAMVGQRMVKQQLRAMPMLSGNSFGMIGRLMASVVSKVGGGELGSEDMKKAAAMKAGGQDFGADGSTVKESFGGKKNIEAELNLRTLF